MTDDQMQRTDITNGSFLRREALFPRSFFSMLDVLSVDSFSPETLRRLGCCTPSGEILSRQAFPIPSSEIYWRSRLRMSFAGIS